MIFIAQKQQDRIMSYSVLNNPETGLTSRLLKKYFLIFSLGLLCLSMTANPPLASKQQIGMFKNSRTCVVFENGISFYNEYIRDAVQKYWKSTTYEFIDQNEFEKRRTDSKYSFIVLMDESYNKDPGGVVYNYINLVLGDASGVLKNMPEFCSIPLSYAGDTGADYEYAIPAIVKFMQIHVKILNMTGYQYF
jgi:exonuclease I